MTSDNGDAAPASVTGPLHRAAKALIDHALYEVGIHPVSHTARGDGGAAAEPALLDHAVRVLTVLECLRRAASGDPATVPSPAGHTARAEITAYWQRRAACAHAALDAAVHGTDRTPRQVAA